MPHSVPALPRVPTLPKTTSRAKSFSNRSPTVAPGSARRQQPQNIKRGGSEESLVYQAKSFSNRSPTVAPGSARRRQPQNIKRGGSEEPLVYQAEELNSILNRRREYKAQLEERLHQNASDISKKKVVLSEIKQKFSKVHVPIMVDAMSTAQTEQEAFLKSDLEVIVRNTMHVVKNADASLSTGMLAKYLYENISSRAESVVIQS